MIAGCQGDVRRLLGVLAPPRDVPGLAEVVSEPSNGPGADGLKQHSGTAVRPAPFGRRGLVVHRPGSERVPEGHPAGA